MKDGRKPRVALMFIALLAGAEAVRVEQLLELEGARASVEGLQKGGLLRSSTRSASCSDLIDQTNDLQWSISFLSKRLALWEAATQLAGQMSASDVKEMAADAAQVFLRGVGPVKPARLGLQTAYSLETDVVVDVDAYDSDLASLSFLTGGALSSDGEQTKVFFDASAKRPTRCPALVSEDTTLSEVIQVAMSNSEGRVAAKTVAGLGDYSRSVKWVLEQWLDYSANMQELMRVYLQSLVDQGERFRPDSVPGACSRDDVEGLFSAQKLLFTHAIYLSSVDAGLREVFQAEQLHLRERVLTGPTLKAMHRMNVADNTHQAYIERVLLLGAAAAVLDGDEDSSIHSLVQVAPDGSTAFGELDGVPVLSALVNLKGQQPSSMLQEAAVFDQALNSTALKRIDATFSPDLILMFIYWFELFLALLTTFPLFFVLQFAPCLIYRVTGNLVSYKTCGKEPACNAMSQCWKKVWEHALEPQLGLGFTCPLMEHYAENGQSASLSCSSQGDRHRFKHAGEFVSCYVVAESIRSRCKCPCYRSSCEDQCKWVSGTRRR